MSAPRATVSADVVAGITVAIVLVPQALAYAQLAGMPPERGLLAAALPPIAAALVASSPYLQTGPVAVTSLLTFGALVGHAATGSDEYVALGLLLALVIGVVRLAIGLLGAGVLAYLVSQPMLIGFMPAAGILIAASQLPALTAASPPEGGILREAAWTLAHPSAWSPAALLLGLGVLAFTVVGVRARGFPSVLVAVVAAALVAAAVDYDEAVVGEIPDVYPSLTLDLPWSKLPALLVPGVVIALVGFAEPASIARTYAVQDRQRWSPDREFASQGLANLAAGLSGGFPVGGSFSRSALNRLSGARTRLSGAVTGIAVLAFLPFGFLVEELPIAALAGVVVAAVVALFRPRPALELARRSRVQFAVAAATFALTLLLAPHVERALAIGIVIAVAVHLHRELRLTVDAERDGETLYVRPSGVLWFGSARAFEDAVVGILAAHPDARRLVLSLEGVGRLDITAADGLRRLVDDARAAGIEISLERTPPHARKLVSQVAGDLDVPATW